MPALPEDLLDRLGPCGLHCGGCLAFQGGRIQTHAQALKELLGPNFQAYADRLGGMDPAFGDYPEFARFLDFLANGRCSGCRGSGCLFQACRVHACVHEQGVDFCFQCADFPCDRHGLAEPLSSVWRKCNERMKSEGVRNYYYWIKDKPRYP